MVRSDTGLLDDYGNDLDAYVWGESEDGRRALVVMDGRSGREAFTVRVQDTRLVGPRWECSATHLDTYADLYRERFPLTS